MLAACILGYGAEVCNAPLYAGGDDISDMFHTFMLATLQCWSMGLLRLDPHNLTAESTDAALCAVQARCLEMGVAPSSNWAQRFVTECNLGFSKRFARANEKHLLALEAAHPRFAAWRAARRELSKQTGRDEAVGHWLSGYTDDIITLIIGVDPMVLFLCMHAEHYGPRGLDMKMAIAAKRSLILASRRHAFLPSNTWSPRWARSWSPTSPPPSSAICREKPCCGVQGGQAAVARDNSVDLSLDLTLSRGLFIVSVDHCERRRNAEISIAVHQQQRARRAAHWNRCPESAARK